MRLFLFLLMMFVAPITWGQTFYRDIAGYGLVNYISFESGTGFNPHPDYDYASFAHTNTFGSPTLGPGLPGLGDAAYFDGVDDYLRYSTFLHENFEDWTITFFFNIDSYTDDQYEGPWHQSNLSGANTRTMLFHSRSDLDLYGPYANHSGGSTNLRQSTPITQDEWHHAAITYSYNAGTSAGTISYYLDGQFVASATTGNVEFANAHNFEIGRSMGYTGNTANFGFFNGWIDEIAIFRGALTPCEIQAIASPLFLHAYVPFDGSSFDELVTSNPETAFNTPSFITGVHGNAVEFDNASSEYVNYSNPLVPNNLGNFSLSFWMKVYSTSTTANGPFHQSQLSGATPATFLYHTWGTNTRGPYINYTNGSSWCNLRTNTTYNSSDWYLVSIVYDGTSITHYLNGVDITTTSCTSLSPGNSFAFDVGRSITYVWNGVTYNASFAYFDGAIDDIRVYNQAYDECFWDALSRQTPDFKTNAISATAEAETENWLEVYPNPTDGKVVATLLHPTTLKLFDATGVLVRDLGHYEAGEHLLDLSNLPSGLYLLRSETTTTRLVLLD